MEDFKKRTSNFLRNFVWWLDYMLFWIINPFSFLERPPKKVAKMLVVELFFIGDLIVTTPAIRALKSRFKNADIYLMLRPSMKDVMSGNPNISGFIEYAPEEIKKHRKHIARKIRDMNFDLAVILHPGSWAVSTLLREAKIPFRVGCTRVGFLSGKGFFLHRKTRPTFKWKHKVEDNLDVVKTIGADSDDKHLEVYSTKEADVHVRDFMKKNKIKRYAVIHAGTQRKTNRWFKNRFARVADWIVSTYNLPVIFTGGKKEHEYVAGIIALMKHKNMAFNLSGNSIKEYFSVIKLSDFVVSVDTSAMHIAAGFDKPVVALFGQGNPVIWRPYCRKSCVIFKDKEAHTSCLRYECKFSGKRHMECMKAVTVEDVLEGIRKVLSKDRKATKKDKICKNK